MIAVHQVHAILRLPLDLHMIEPAQRHFVRDFMHDVTQSIKKSNPIFRYTFRQHFELMGALNVRWIRSRSTRDSVDFGIYNYHAGLVCYVDDSYAQLRTFDFDKTADFSQDFPSASPRPLSIKRFRHKVLKRVLRFVQREADSFLMQKCLQQALLMQTTRHVAIINSLPLPTEIQHIVLKKYAEDNDIVLHDITTGW